MAEQRTIRLVKAEKNEDVSRREELERWYSKVSKEWYSSFVSRYSLEWRVEHSDQWNSYRRIKFGCQQGIIGKRSQWNLKRSIIEATHEWEKGVSEGYWKGIGRIARGRSACSDRMTRGWCARFTVRGSARVVGAPSAPAYQASRNTHEWCVLPRAPSVYERKRSDGAELSSAFLDRP